MRDPAGVEAARRLLRQGRSDEAATLIDELRANDPADPEVWRLDGVLRATGRAPLDPARAPVAAGRGEVALDIAGAALTAAPRPNDAIAAYETALRTRGDYGETALALARTLIETGRAAAAVHMLAPRVAADTERAPGLWTAYGDALAADGRRDEALDAYARGLAQNPGDAETRRALANLLVEAGRPGAALREIGRLSPEARKEVSSRRLEGAARVANGDPEAALEIFLEVGLAPPGSHEALFAAMHLLWSLGRESEIEPLFEQALVRLGFGLKVWTLYARTLMLLGRLKQALNVVVRAEETCGQRPEIDLVAAEILIETRWAEAALGRADAAVRGLPGAIEPLAALARASLMLGEARIALTACAHALAARPADVVWRAIEATALKLSGRPVDPALIAERDLAPPEGYDMTRDFNQALMAHLEPLHAGADHRLDRPMRKRAPTIVPHDDAAAGPLAGLRDAVEAQVAAIAAPGAPRPPDSAAPDYPVPVWRVRRMRSIRDVAGAPDPAPIRADGVLSAVYCVVEPRGGEDPSPARLRLGEPPFPVPGAAPERSIPLEAGRLVIHASSVWSAREPAEGGARLLIAMDVTPE